MRNSHDPSIQPSHDFTNSINNNLKLQNRSSILSGTNHNNHKFFKNHPIYNREDQHSRAALTQPNLFPL
jgi:hypothetical protein